LNASTFSKRPVRGIWPNRVVLNGHFRGLAPILVFSGTRDLFYPDCVDLADKARAAGVPVELHLRQGQPHNYAALPTPEGREARAIIRRAVS